MINPTGPWKVTTAHDDLTPDEDLGIFEGPIDRIALGLATLRDEPRLRFFPVVPTPADKLPLVDRDVHIQVEAPGVSDRATLAHSLLCGRPIRTEASIYRGYVRIVATEQYDEEYRQAALLRARDKLTPQELAALLQAYGVGA